MSAVLASPEPTRIMIVEDEALIALALAEMLRELGYVISDIVHTGYDAVSRTLAQQPDLVLMDIMLRGEMDGIAAAETLRHDVQVPIIYCSAYSDADTVRRAARTGANGFITKPYQANQVRALIETTLQQSRLERQVRESEKWYSTTLRCVGDAVLATDVNGHIRFVNVAAERILDRRLSDIRGCAVDDFIALEAPGATSPRANPLYDVLAKRDFEPIVSGTCLVDTNGRRTPIEDSLSRIEDDNGNLLGAVMVFRDISERLRLQDELSDTQELYTNAFELAAAGVALVGLDERVERANAALHAFLGYAETTLAGYTFTQLVDPAYRAREHELRLALVNGESRGFQDEILFRRDDGSSVWGLACGALLRNASGEATAYFLQILDIDRRKQAEAELARLAHFDGLTGLVNRHGLQLETTRAVAQARRHENRFGLLFMDIDNFKRVNDTFGHEVGDRLLAEIGQRLRRLSRTTDVIARMGGDEFVILVGDLRDVSDLMPLAEKIRAAVARPLMLGDHEVRMSASIGISIFPDDSEDVGELIRDADSALYQAKSLGRDTIAFYRAELTTRTGARLRLESDLRRAVENGDLTLHYQPILDLPSGRVAGVEALARWPRGTTMVPPDQFIGVAEECGLIVSIGQWVLNEACAAAAHWRAHGHPGLYVAVNISARQMREAGFVATVAAALETSGLPATGLMLEITENQVFGITPDEMLVVDELQRLGLALAIDDFGVGYSSLTYLKRFNPQRLKIDRSFIRDVLVDPSDAAIVSATIVMAHKLGLEVVAEGVENATQLEFLRGENCDAVQGFHLGRPMPASAVTGFLELNTVRRT